MSNTDGTMSCKFGCWLIAALGGIVGAVLLTLLGEWTFLQAVFAGFVIAVIAGLLLSWLICRPLPKLGEAGRMDPADTPLARASAEREAAAPSAAAGATAAAAAAPAAPAPEAEPEPAPKAGAAADAASDVDAAAGTASANAPADVKPSTTLAGEEELAARKGEWKYEKPEGDGAPAAKAADAAPEPAPAPAPAAADTDADPVAEAAAAVPAGEEKKPETLSAARDGGPDDLKMIKGVGPKLEALLHSLGFFHFDQVASWKAAEVAWVDQNLQGFKGRVSRDNWVAQAKVLAEGGTTAFSSKVKKGGVYD